MAGKFVALMAGAAVLGMVGVASASEPISLTDVQLDQISAGGARVSINLTGDAIVNGSFFLDNWPGVFSVANINATIVPFGSATLDVNASADTFD